VALLSSHCLRDASKGRLLLVPVTPHYVDASVALYLGDCFDVLAALPDASVDALVSDPPYGIGFMGREWDTFKPGTGATRKLMHPREREAAKVVSDNPNINGRHRSPALSPSQIDYDYSVAGLRRFQEWTEGWAREAFRVLKSGGHAVVCGAPRAYHRMASGLEDAGFEIRDCLAWLFGSGFPKSLNLGEGLGTALKPAHEPIVLARKPFKGTVAANVATHRTGALNIDACRIESDCAGAYRGDEPSAKRRYTESGATNFAATPGPRGGNPDGRWPANVCIDELAGMVIDEQSGELTSGFMAAGTSRDGIGYHGGLGDTVRNDTIGDSGGASRFYYCAKPSREERDYGTEGLIARQRDESRKAGNPGGDNPRNRGVQLRGNFHPTVKPVELMRWLVRLITPPGGVVIDPFLGSGTTGMACRYEQRRFIGIEREADYMQIAERRIRAVAPLFSEASA
jgi:DNA modification methylase